MAWSGGQVLEHRYVMAQYLGRCLERWEIVHHKNGICSDNRIENLQVVTPSAHEAYNWANGKLTIEVQRMRDRIVWLEAENKSLKEQLQRLLEANLT